MDCEMAAQDTKNHFTHPSWILETGLVSALRPEPPYLQKYCGAQCVDAEEEYKRAFSDAALADLAAAGVNIVWFRFFGGFGVEFEKKEIERAREFIVRAHAQGLKAAALIALGALTPETLLAEEPGCQNWLQVNRGGVQPCVAPGQSWRARPCYNSENYLRYMERVCDQAAEAETDLIHFDCFGNNAEPDTCRCPVCVAGFRDFLRKRYGGEDGRSREAGRERFGHNVFTHIRPPAAAAAAGLDGPHQQEWQEFKVRSLAGCLVRLVETIRKRAPHCAVGADLMRGFEYGQASLHSLSIQDQLPHLDCVRLVSSSGVSAPAFFPFTSQSSPSARQLELFPVAQASSLPPGPPSPGLRASCPQPKAGTDSQFASQIGVSPFSPLLGLLRAMKVAHSYGVAFESTAAQADCEAALALSFACGGLGLAVLNWNLSGACPEASALLRSYLNFYAQYKRELFLGARPLVSCGVFHDGPSLALSGEAQAGLEQVENLLLEQNVGYDVLFAGDLEKLTSYRCLVLPNSVCLSDQLAAKIEQYVGVGGGLVMTGETGWRDPWLRVRKQTVLHALLGDCGMRPVRRSAGAGRVAFLPQVGAEGLLEAIHFASGMAWPWNVECQDGKVLAQALKTAGGDVVLHVVNPGPEGASGLCCALACSEAPKQILPLSPAQTFQPLRFNWDNGRVYFAFDTVAKYVAFLVAIDD
jgi:hypothetical protein